jgi:hypothetical protein
MLPLSRAPSGLASIPAYRRGRRDEAGGLAGGNRLAECLAGAGLEGRRGLLWRKPGSAGNRAQRYMAAHAQLADAQSPSR